MVGAVGVAAYTWRVTPRHLRALYPRLVRRGLAVAVLLVAVYTLGLAAYVVAPAEVVESGLLCLQLPLVALFVASWVNATRR
jgi:hypothetical protein